MVMEPPDFLKQDFLYIRFSHLDKSMEGHYFFFLKRSDLIVSFQGISCFQVVLFKWNGSFYLSYGLLWKANSALNTSQGLISALKQALIDADGGGDEEDDYSGCGEPLGEKLKFQERL